MNAVATDRSATEALCLQVTRTRPPCGLGPVTFLRTDGSNTHRVLVTLERKNHSMQYVIIVYQGTTPIPNTPGWATLSEDEQQAIYADYAAINQMPEVTPGLPLGLPTDARTVTVVDGQAEVYQGPYLRDLSKAAAGYSVVEADDIDTVVAIAARIPAARHGGAVEIRPAKSYW
jgi:hypothetical protein